MSVTLKAGKETCELSRNRFSHALNCMGLNDTPWGSIPAETMLQRIKIALQHLNYAPQEFTASEMVCKVGKENVTFPALGGEETRMILMLLQNFVQRSGITEVTY